MELFTLVLGALFVAQADRSGTPAERAWTANSNAAVPGAISRERLSALGGRPAAGSSGQNSSGEKATAAAGTSASHRALTPELVASSFGVPAGGTLVGRPLSLLESLDASTDRSRQLEIVHAYWRLAAAVGEYRLRFDAAQRWRRLEPRTDDVAALRTERSKATEALRSAELEAQRAQQTLVEAAGLSPGAPPPLPSDLPHVGPYRTNFDEVYAMQNVPARARLIHRTLPLRRKGIDARATAVQAAEDALEAATDAYREGGDLAAIAACLARTVEQRAALVGDVCQFNREIADYALAVAAAHAPPRTLVSMLILPGVDAASGGTDGLASPRALPTKQSAVTPASAVEPAAWITPVPEGRPESDSGLPGVGQPTLAPPKRSVLPPELAPPPPKPAAEADKAASAPAPPGNRGDRHPGEERREPGSRGPRVPPDKPRAAEKSGLAEKDGTAKKDAKDTPDDAVKDPFATPRMVQRPTGTEGPGTAGASSPALYPALISVPAGARVKHLSATLHWNRNLPQDTGRPVELEECLRGLSGTDRRSVIDAYWIARQRTAEYQVLVGQAELIDELVPLALDHRRQPTGPLDMLRIRTARLACEADIAAAQVDLLQSLFELTRRTGRALDGPWLVPATAPHAGQYLLKLEAQRPEIVKQPAMQRLAAAVPALNEALREQAAAVVEADTARAAATTAYQLSGKNIDQLLTGVRSQTVETFAFLRMLTAYNQAIAEYALTVLPPAISGEQLVQTLVIIR